MQSISQLTSFISGTVPAFANIAIEDLFVFSFFWIGFLLLRFGVPSRLCSLRQKASAKDTDHHSLSSLHDDFTHRRYEKVLESWPLLSEHTAEALSIVVSALLALGRPEDIGDFVAQTSAKLPHLRQDLHKVVAACGAPTCQVRHQHVLCALRDLHERARDVLDQAAMKELLLAFAKASDDERVATLIDEMASENIAADPAFLSQVVRNFLLCHNLDAALEYLQQILSVSSATESPHELIIEVIKSSTEAELGDDSTDGVVVRPKAWDALDALRGVKLSSAAAVLFLEWSGRQTPVDVDMANRVEKLVRKAGPLSTDACDALVRVHASTVGDDEEKAVEFFDELVRVASGTEPSETSLIGMISSCMGARNDTLAEHIFGWVQTEDRCTSSIVSCTLKVLAASDKAERVCAIYETVSSNKAITLDEALIEQIAECAAQSGNADLARTLSKAAQAGKAAIKQNPLSAMRACAQEGDLEAVVTLLKDIQDQGDASTVIYNCALDVCVSAGNADASKSVLKEMKASGLMDVASYNIMLKQCLSEGVTPKAAQAVITEMSQRGLEPNTATYNSLLSISMAAGDFAGVWTTVNALESSGQSADIYTLSIIFKGHRRERRTMDAEAIDKALALIAKHSVKVDEYFVNVALEACLALKDARCTKKALDTLWNSGWTMPKQATMQTYGLLIKAYGQSHGLKEAWELWTELTQEKHMEPSEQLYGQMLDVLVGNDSLEDALKIFQDMKAAHKSSLSSQGFAVAYAMIIRGFAQQKDCARALQCYEEMKSHGTKASLVVLNTLIDACSRVGDMRSAAKLFQDMSQSQCVPDLITYSTLIKGHCNNEDLEQALQLFGLMQEKGIRPDAIVFNSLLDGCAKKQTPALCEQVIQDMEAAGVVPSNYSASILIKLYGRCKDLDAAFRVINDMPKKYGFRPNNAVYTCLMSACIANGALDDAMDLRTRMVNENVYPDERTYSTLLRGALRASSVDYCLTLVNSALEQKGNRPRQLLEDDLVRSVLILTQRQSLWETKGLELQNGLRAAGIVVRLPLPSDSCGRQDGFGSQNQQREKGSGKGTLNSFRDQGFSKDARYQQQYQQQRR